MSDYVGHQGSRDEHPEFADRLSAIESKLKYLEDRQKILEVYRRYTRGLNRYDIELLRLAFWADARITYGFKTSRRDEWIEDWQELRGRGVTSQAHHILNESMDIAEDAAHVEVYLIAFHRARDDTKAMIKAGRYVDRVDCRNGEWRIAVREFLPHFWVEVNSVFAANFTAESWPQTADGMGAEDKSDPSYRRPLL